MDELRVLRFAGIEVRAVLDETGDAWWSLSELCHVLGKNYVLHVARILSERHKRIVDLSYLYDSPLRGMAISQAGTHYMILNKKKESAEQFMAWMMDEAGPKLRQPIDDSQREASRPVIMRC